MASRRIIASVIVIIVLAAAVAAFAVIWRPAIAAIDPPRSFDAALVKQGRALAALGEIPGVVRVHRTADEVDAFVSDFWNAGTAADLSVLRWLVPRKLEFACRVSAGLAAGASAGAPLTHRGMAQAVTFVTGHAASG